MSDAFIMSRPVDEADFPVKVRCLGCNREITLWFNGGELDNADCCGRRYAIVATGYLLTISSRGVPLAREPEP